MLEKDESDCRERRDDLQPAGRRTGGPQAEGPASWPNERLVRPGHVGARRLDGGHSDRGRRGPRYLGRRPLSEFLFMGADASSCWDWSSAVSMPGTGSTRNTRKCRRTPMSDIPALALAFVAGSMLGVLFFGGLWWTVQKGVTSDLPAFWFLGSLLLRTGAILAGFYLVSQGHWSRLVACLLGFVIARVIVVRRLTHEPPTEQIPSGRGDHHCALLPMTLFSGGTDLSSSIARSSPPGA